MNDKNHTSPGPVHALVGQLREMLAKASPRQWRDIPNPSWNRANHQVRIDDGYSYGCFGEIAHASPENAAIIVAAINALPALLDVAEAAQSVQDGMDMRDEDEAEWAAAGYRVSAMEMHDRRMRLASALRLLPNPEVCGPAQVSPTGEKATVAGSVSTDFVGQTSRFYGHCRDCRHLNTCNLSPLPEGGCVNWEKP